MLFRTLALFLSLLMPSFAWSLADHPQQVFKAGQIHESQALIDLVDSKFPGAQYRPDQSIWIKYGGETYMVLTRKVNETDVPAMYRIQSVTNLSKPVPAAAPVFEVPKPRTPPPRPSAVDCNALSKTMELWKPDAAERATLVAAARNKGECR